MLHPLGDNPYEQCKCITHVAAGPGGFASFQVSIVVIVRKLCMTPHEYLQREGTRLYVAYYSHKQRDDMQKLKPSGALEKRMSSI